MMIEFNDKSAALLVRDGMVHTLQNYMKIGCFCLIFGEEKYSLRYQPGYCDHY